MVWVFGALDQNPNNIFWHCAFQTPHPRHPKTPFLAYRVQRYGCLGRRMRTQNHFSALCISNTPILGIQKHFCWPVGYSGMRGWGATPEPKQCFLLSCILNTPILGIQKHLCWPMGYSGMGVWAATPEPNQYFLELCILNTPILGIRKHLCWLLLAVLWMVGAPPQNPDNSFWHCAFQAPPF